MASIKNNPASNSSGNAQLVGIVSSVPMPKTTVPTMANGTPVMYNPTGGTMDMGGSSQSFSVQPSVVPGTPAAIFGASTTGGGGLSLTPAVGAQPPQSGAAGPTAAASGAASVTLGADANGNLTPAGGDAASGAGQSGAVVMAVSSNVGTNHVQAPAAGVAAKASDSAPEATAVSVSGFGAADRNSKMVAKLGNGSTFSFPSFNSTKRSSAAPDIAWGDSWKRVDKGDGFFYMQDADGNKAVPAVEWRMTPAPLDAAKTIKVAHGWGKKLPDGTVIVFDKTEGPYYLDPKGAKHKLTPGVHTFGGVKVRIFEASVVRVLEPDGAVSVFDSRGNHGAGTPRTTDPNGGPSSAAGGGKMASDASGVPVSAGGPTPTDPAALAAQIAKVTDVARGLLQQVQGGKIDTGALQSLQAQLSELPDGIRQAVGGAGISTGDAASLGLAPPVDGGGPTAAEVAAGGPAAANGTPVAGAAAAPTSERLAAGTSVHLDVAKPYAGTKRFAQLPEDLQDSIAAAYGSELTTAAFEPDTQFTISANGDVKLTAAATVYKKPEAHITGGGPGEDLAMTLKPVRQSKWTNAGGDSTDGTASADAMTPTSAPGSTVAGGGATSGADSDTRRTIFGAGERATIPALTSATSGTFNWAGLPADVRQAIEAYLESSTASTAGAAWINRPGSGWDFDPTATVVISGAQVTFPNGIAITRSGAASEAASSTPAAGSATPAPPGADLPSGITPPPSSGPTSTPIGHDANVTPAPPNPPGIN